MSELFASISEIWKNYIWQPITEFTFWDALDILLLTLALYGVFLFLKGRRAVKLAIGLVLIMLLYGISDLAGLRAIHRLIATITPFFVVLLAIIFQPEIRDGLERLGDKPFGFFLHHKDQADTAKVINEVVDAVCQIAQTNRDGALIVLERSTPLGDFVARGHALDAEVTSELLRNIFVTNSPLHDNAVIIRNNRIAAARCKLPPTTNEEMVRGLGSRHSAAVGISEVSDCVVVVVSEERHVISIANNGFLKKNYNQRADEFQNETRAKAIQKALRNDLTRILMEDLPRNGNSDLDIDEDERGILIPEIQFIWRVTEKKQASAVSDAAETAAQPKTRKRSRPAPREKAMSYRIAGTEPSGETLKAPPPTLEEPSAAAPGSETLSDAQSDGNREGE